MQCPALALARHHARDNTARIAHLARSKTTTRASKITHTSAVRPAQVQIVSAPNTLQREDDIFVCIPSHPILGLRNGTRRGEG
eukprot:325584-Rhodomonas_salina.1